MKVTVWNEGVHEKTYETVRKIYPRGIHGAIAQHLSKQPDLETLDEPEHGLPESVLAQTAGQGIFSDCMYDSGRCLSHAAGRSASGGI